MPIQNGNMTALEKEIYKAKYGPDVEAFATPVSIAPVSSTGTFTPIEVTMDMPFTSKILSKWIAPQDIDFEAPSEPKAIMTESVMLVGWKWPLAESETEAEHMEFLYNDPVGFWKAVKAAWSGLRTTQEKADYINLIFEWVHKHMSGYIIPQLNANYYPEMLDSLGLSLMGWVTENVMTDAIGHYWISWLSADPAGFVLTVKTEDEKITPEDISFYH